MSDLTYNLIIFGLLLLELCIDVLFMYECWKVCYVVFPLFYLEVMTYFLLHSDMLYFVMVVAGFFHLCQRIVQFFNFLDIVTCPDYCCRLLCFLCLSVGLSYVFVLRFFVLCKWDIMCFH